MKIPADLTGVLFFSFASVFSLVQSTVPTLSLDDHKRNRGQRVLDDFLFAVTVWEDLIRGVALVMPEVDFRCSGARRSQPQTRSFQISSTSAFDSWIRHHATCLRIASSGPLRRQHGLSWTLLPCRPRRVWRHWIPCGVNGRVPRSDGRPVVGTLSKSCGVDDRGDWTEGRG